MRISIVGGGPSGLYLAILMRKADPGTTVTLLERNRPDDTFGFGVVFSDATLERLERADGPSYRAITESFAHWDDIDVHYRGQLVRSTGHGFAGMSRQKLLDILQGRCRELGVELAFQREVASLDELVASSDLVVGADGVASTVRARLEAELGPEIDWRPNRFVWLGTSFPFSAFTFYFKENAHGLFRVHAYRYEPGGSTFIVECTEDAFLRSGLESASEDDTVAYCEELFADELKGHRLRKNRSIWRRFPTVRNRRWHHGNVVLLGDAAHTAHFSVGSGTKLAMEDSIALAEMLAAHRDVGAALAAYEAARRPVVESLQRSAQVSLEWFENTERFTELEPLQFSFSLLTRSLRVTHANLRLRDPGLVERVDGWFAERARAQVGAVPAAPAAPPPPPMFTPYRIRDLVLENRIVVSPMCQYAATDGTVGDWHLVHLGSRALGGAGLVMSEMTDVSPEGRITPGCAGMYAPEHVPAWARVVAFVRSQSRARIGIQLAHAGRKGSCAVVRRGHDHPLEEGGWTTLAPSPIPFAEGWPAPREMDRADMDKVRDDFVRATRMADEAGFDLVELHAAHGYLLSSFISPLSNVRTDAYGGSLEGRMRFPLEVLRAVREAWPAAKPIAVRISACDWAPGGITPADAVEVARLLHAAGCDVVDVSSGGTVSHARVSYARLYQTPFSERIRLEAGIPTMTVGNVSSWEDVNSVLAAGRADLCVIARAHLYDPYFTLHAAMEQGVEHLWPDPYAVMEGYAPPSLRRSGP